MQHAEPNVQLGPFVAWMTVLQGNRKVLRKSLPGWEMASGIFPGLLLIKQLI